jgi:hypothetical protein
VNARPIVSLTAAAALAAAGFAAASASASTQTATATTLPPCVHWTDPSGDAFFQDSPAGQPADDTLDITAAKYSVKNGVFTAKITVPKFSSSGTARDGDAFDALMTVAGHQVDIFANTGATWAVLSNAFAQQGIQVDGTYVQKTNAAVKRTDGTGTVTISVSLTDLSSAVGASVAKKPASALEVRSSGGYEAFTEVYDYAPAPSSAKFTLAPCK